MDQIPPPADWSVLLQEAEDLFNALSEDVLAINIFHLVTFTTSAAQSVDDLVYYRFGFLLNEYPYFGVPPAITPVAFRSFQEVVWAVGG
jgi:hypothetical protein